MLVVGGASGLSGARASPQHFLSSAVCQLFYQLCFTFCLLLTDAAKALLLISLAPLWAALFGTVVLHEHLPRKTMVAMALSLVSVFLVLMPQLLPLIGSLPSEHAPSNKAQHGQTSVTGDLLAFATGIAQGASLTVSRHAALHNPRADLTLATALSSVAATIVAIELPCYDLEDVHNFWACTPPVWRQPGFLLLASCDALAVALFYLSMLIAPRYITGGEVALVMLCEDVLGPFWVFVRFGDVPTPWTLAGGALLIITLAGHELVGIKGKSEGRAMTTMETSPLPAPRSPTPASPYDEDQPYHRMAIAPSAI